MKMEVKVENNFATATGNSNQSRRCRDELTRIRPEFKGETIDMDGGCFDYSNRNHGNNYSQRMRKVAEYFGRTDRYGTDI